MRNGTEWSRGGGGSPEAGCVEEVCMVITVARHSLASLGTTGRNCASFKVDSCTFHIFMATVSDWTLLYFFNGILVMVYICSVKLSCSILFVSNSYFMIFFT